MKGGDALRQRPTESPATNALAVLPHFSSHARPHPAASKGGSPRDCDHGTSTIAGALARHASRYDGARLNETSLASINAHDASPAANPLASATGPGWSYYFDHGKPNASGTTTVLGDITHTLYRSDERVASTTAVEASCAFWNTLQVALPSGALDPTTGCPVNSPCKAGKKQLSYLYGANPGTGDQCLYVGGSPARSTTTQTLVPPHIGKLVAYVSSGQVSFGLTSVRIPQGGTNISLGDAQDVTSIMQWIPLDRQTEACRHSSKTGTPPTNCK